MLDRYFILRSIQCTSRAVLAGAILAVAASPAALAGEKIGDPIEPSIEPIGARVILESISTGMTAPLWAISPPGHPDTLAVVDQDGILWSVDLTTNEKTSILDVSARLVPLGAFGPGTFDERGFLGVAFHPDFTSNGLLYTYESHPVSGPADFSTIGKGEKANHQTVISRWTAINPASSDFTVDANSAVELLRIDQPQFNHNAGALNFGPDGLLYISLGDGGAADDQGVGHPPMGNGQDITTILGSVLRIDPMGSNSDNRMYGIPADNPFVGKDGVDEIYAWGFRNPYRFSFDQQTGSLWLGDVGQNHIEEVDIVTKGGNYGWRVKEGTFLFDANGEGDGFVFADSPGAPADMIDPVAQYDHDEGVAVVGGFIYRAVDFPAMEGKYVFGDTSESGDNDGRLFHLNFNGDIVEFRYEGDAFAAHLTGMGQDAAGRVYALSNEEGVPFEKTGQVVRITPALIGDLDEDELVDGEDLGILLKQFGEFCPTDDVCDADLNGDGQITGIDLGILLLNFGAQSNG